MSEQRQLSRKRARPSTRRILVALGSIALVLLLLASACTVAIAKKVPELFSDPVFLRCQRDLDDLAEEILRDAKALDDEPLGRIVIAGPDAGPFLNPLFDWLADGKVVQAGALPSVSNLSLDDAAASPELLRGLDFSWMARLREFSTWDIESNSAISTRRTFNLVTRPAPDTFAIKKWAKLRLLAGDLRGDRASAEKDVAALGALCMQTEWLALVTAGIQMQTLATTNADAQARLDVMERLTWAQTAYPRILVSTAQQRALAARSELAPFRCAGLNEALSSSLLVRGYLIDDLPAEYAELSAVLDGSRAECRLTWLRSAWAAIDHEGELAVDPASLCLGGEEDGLCALPRATFLLPGLRFAAGGVLASIGIPNWTRGYRPAQENGPE